MAHQRQGHPHQIATTQRSTNTSLYSELEKEDMALVKYNRKESTSDILVFDFINAEGAIGQNVDARYEVEGSTLIGKMGSIKTKSPSLHKDTKVLFRYIKKDGTPGTSRYAQVEEKDGNLFIAGKIRPSKEQITISCAAYVLHKGVIDGTHATENTTLIDSNLLKQVRLANDLFNAVAEEHRRLRNACIKVTPEELATVRDTIIQSCEAFNKQQGRGAKLVYKELAATATGVEGDLEYGHITRFYFRTLKGFINKFINKMKDKNTAPTNQPMVGEVKLSDYLKKFIDASDATIDYSGINNFNVAKTFEKFSPQVAPDLYRTVYDKTVSKFSAILKQRDTKQKKSKGEDGKKGSSRTLGFHQGWPKATFRKGTKQYTNEEEYFYYFGKGASDWCVSRRLSEGGNIPTLEDFESANGKKGVKFFPPVAPHLSGHPDMSPYSLAGQRKLRKVQFQFAGGAPSPVELSVLFDRQDIDPSSEVAQVVLGHRKGKGMYMNFVVNINRPDLNIPRTNKTIAISPHFKRVGNKLEIATGVDSDGGRISLTLPLDGNWDVLENETQIATSSISSSNQPKTKDPNSLRSRYNIVKDDVYFRKSLSWASVYASGVEETPEAAQEDIEFIKSGIRNLTLTNHALLYRVRNLSWSEKVSALRNAVNEIGNEILTDSQRREVHWELVGYRGLKEILSEQRNAMKVAVGQPIKTRGVTPSTKKKEREGLPFIPKLYQTLELWARLSDRAYKYQNWGKEILTDRVKSLYYLYAHRLFSTYGTVLLWNPDLEALQKNKDGDEVIDNSSKFRQWATLSTLKTAFLAVSAKYASSLTIYSHKNREKGLSDMASAGKIVLVTDVSPNTCSLCGKEGTSSPDMLTCPDGHVTDRYENRALLMMGASPVLV